MLQMAEGRMQREECCYSACRYGEWRGAIVRPFSCRKCNDNIQSIFFLSLLSLTLLVSFALACQYIWISLTKMQPFIHTYRKTLLWKVQYTTRNKCHGVSSLVCHFHPILTFVRKAGANPSGANVKISKKPESYSQHFIFFVAYYGFKSICL